MLVSGAALAAITTTPTNNGSKSPSPCEQIIIACKNAGYAGGMARKGKDIFRNCMNPILASQSVQGVSVDPLVAQACQQQKAARKKHKKE